MAFDRCSINDYLLTYPEAQRVATKRHYIKLTLIPTTGGEITPSTFVENRIVSSGMRQLLFVTLLQTPWAFRSNSSISLYLLPIFHVAGSDVTSK